MFWFFGGGFTAGAGAKPYYDGTKLNERDVILVTFNYRLGPLGFLPLDDKGTGALNGISDGIAALKFV